MTIREKHFHIFVKYLSTGNSETAGWPASQMCWFIAFLVLMYYVCSLDYWLDKRSCPVVSGQDVMMTIFNKIALMPATAFKLERETYKKRWTMLFPYTSGRPWMPLKIQTDSVITQ